MKWLITGGAGFIGTNVAIRLIESGNKVVLIDNFYRSGTRDNERYLMERYHLPIQYLDIRFRDQVFEFWQAYGEFDVVLHLAGQVSLVASLENPIYDFDTNALGTINVLEATRRFSPNAKFIYSSTNKVYGNLDYLRYEETETRYILPEYPNGLPETLPLSFHGGYSCSKGAADQYVLDYHRVYGLKTVSLRQSSIYGGYQRATEDQGWVAYFVRVGIEARPFRIFGNGKQVRDILHVNDLFNLYAAIGALSEDSPVFGKAYNVGGGVQLSLSLLELFALLRQRYGFQFAYVSEAPRLGDQKIFVADFSRLTKETGWTPKVGIGEGLDELVRWSKTLLGRG